uniref:Uncharacterized protein n=1 Tax=Plectus sambesii TaxID=2011161 RepID=A0A914VD06_9BILA
MVKLPHQERAPQKSNVRSSAQQTHLVSIAENKAKRLIGFRIPSLDRLNQLKQKSVKEVRDEESKLTAGKNAIEVAISKHSFFTTIKQLLRLGGSHTENPLKLHFIFKGRQRS